MKRLPDITPFKRRQRGSALIAILWIIAILTIAVFSATQFLFIELESDSNASSLFRAEQLADRGIALGSHPDIQRGDPLLIEQVSDNESYSARISSEGDRLNLNRLLEHPETDRLVLEELFTTWGLRRDHAVDVVDNLIDWVDIDEDQTNQGAERAFYFEQGRSNHPFNRQFDALEEVEMVNLFDQVMAANPLWKESFTLLSAGPLDVNEAPADLIAAACECGTVAAEGFVGVRNGFDGIPGTQDDLRFETMEMAVDQLGIPEAFEERVLPRIAIEDPARRIISVGRLGRIAVERSVTIQYSADQGEILKWSTRRIE